MQGVADIPTWLATAWGISEGVAQIILSFAVIIFMLLPVMYFTKNAAVLLIVIVLAECLLVGLGWIPFWILIATVAMMAIAVASLGTNAVTGE